MYQSGENGYVESSNPLTGMSLHLIFEVAVACCSFQYKSYAHVLLDLN